MFKRVLTYSGGVFGSASLSTILLPSYQDGNRSAQSHAEVARGYQDFAIFANSVEGREIQLRKYEISDGFEVDPSIEPPMSRASVVESLKELETRPLQRDEIESAIAVVAGGADTIKGRIDVSYMQLVTHSLCNDGDIGYHGQLTELALMLMTTDPSLTSAVVRSLTSLAETTSVAPQGPGRIQYTIDDAWHELRQRYKCSLCLDVLCAPHLLVSCTHSFCGGCIHEHLELNSSDCDVVCCPKCRQEIDQLPCYEPDFDNTILAAVEQAPPSEDKRLWFEKREVFLRRMKLTKGKEKHHPHDAVPQTWEEFAAHPLLHNVLGLIALVIMVAIFRRKFQDVL